MTKKLRYEIMAIIMILLTLTLLGILIVINVISTSKTNREEQNALQFYIDSKQKNEKPGNRPPSPENDNEYPGEHSMPGEDTKNDDRPFRFYPLFYAEYAKDGTLLRMESNQTDSYSEDTLLNYFQKILQEKKEQGTLEGFRYLRRQTPYGQAIALIDCHISQSHQRILLFSTILVGIVSLILFALFSFFLSGLVVKPVEEAFQKQKDFICAAGHELKTPLTVIMANSELLHDQYGENKWLSYIQSECEQMSKLISSLLTLTHLEQDNDFKNCATRFNLSDALLERILPFESVAFEKEVHFHYTISPELYVLGIREQLQQILSILLDNALSYTLPKGSIDVTLIAYNHNALLTVSNTGEEIALENREKLFDRFYREDKARSRENGHFGLGLSIAKSILTKHHGDIHVSCQNGVTSFTASVPLVSPGKQRNYN